MIVLDAKLCACGCGYPVTCADQTWLKGHDKRKPDPGIADLIAATARVGACQEWQRSRNSDGYGNVWSGGKCWKAHRLAWTLRYGPIPAGMEVCHSCDNPPCLRDEHLFLASHAENMRDAATKLRFGNRRDQRGALNAQAKLELADVVAMRLMYHTGLWTQQQLAERYGLIQTTVGQIVRGDRWKHAPGPLRRRDQPFDLWDVEVSDDAEAS